MRNPKQADSNLFDCKVQRGPCPLGCNQCYYNHGYYHDINRQRIPDPKEVVDGIVRFNCGHDSNLERDNVITASTQYKRYFFNTSIPRFDFPGPVVFTANPQEQKPAILVNDKNIMFVRLRVSKDNIGHIIDAAQYYTSREIPVVLTFMAYYDDIPEDWKKYYTWQIRHINSYWCPNSRLTDAVIRAINTNVTAYSFIYFCGKWCKDCRNCETLYIKFQEKRDETNILSRVW